MKTIILCGGRGTRLNEMGTVVPKALVPIGSKPLIWHLMRHYTSYGFDEFILCVGFLKEKIVEYFHEAGVRSADTRTEWQYFESDGLKCRVCLVNTGLDTNTGGRLKAVEQHCAGDERIFVTYGDGLSDVDLQGLYSFHKEHRKSATLTAVHPISNFGILKLGSDSSVAEFQEKPILDDWINGGFFVFDRQIFDRLDRTSVLEHQPLATLAKDGELMAYKHSGFWKCMDTYKDNAELNHLWETNAPWKSW